MKKRLREPKPIIPALSSASGVALIKHLASCDTKERSQSLRLVQSWLASQSHQLSASDIKKLWKGLFYCMWHADKTPNQVALIDKLTSLFFSLQPVLSLEFFREFLLTLRREWSGIDRLRLDKFYLLIRRFVRALFELMRFRKWDCEVLGEYMEILEKNVFLAEDKFQGNGVNYHVVSVFLEELRGVKFPVTRKVVDLILKPFYAVMLRGRDRILLGKVKSCIFDELVKIGKAILERKKTGLHFEEEDKDVLLSLVALKMGLSSRLYDMGSSVDCVQGNRKLVLGLHEEYLNLEKECELSGIEFTIPEFDSLSGNTSDDTQVPYLIPIVHDSINGGDKYGEPGRDEDVPKVEGSLVTRSLKKCRKGEPGIEGNHKKEKSKKKKRRKEKNEASQISSMVEEHGDEAASNDMENRISFTACEDSPSDNLANDCTAITMNQSMIANLQNEFEKIATEAGYANNEDGGLPDSSAHHGDTKKRKRIKGVQKEHSHLNGVISDPTAKSVEKSDKKVRFVMKNNLVWKPQTPLPPASLRLPPSVAPRGSALKKGVPPGPIVEMSPAKKKTKPKKARKVFKKKSQK